MLTRRLFLEGLECQCRIGAYDHERLGPQRVIIDIALELSADTEPGRDHLEDTLNYDLVRQAVLGIAGARHFDLQETLAREIFDALGALSVCKLESTRGVGNHNGKLLLDIGCGTNDLSCMAG